MKKHALILIFNIFLIFQYFPCANAYLLFEPFPNIETDKLEYFLDDNISIHASWNIYSPIDEETHIKIFFINIDPGSLTPSWVINNSLYEIECPFENDYNYFQTSIQSSIFSLQLPSTLWVILMIYNMQDEILINNDIFWNWTQISLNKYNPIFSNQIEDQINLEFKDNYFINNSIVAQQNISKFYSNGIISATLKLDSFLIDIKEYNISVKGSFLINLNDFDISITGLYNLSLKIVENELFFGKYLFQIFNITEKIIQITTLNNNKYIYDSSIDFFLMEIQLLDKNNIKVVLNDPTWVIQTNLNQIDSQFINNCYYIKFNYPELSGKYFVNISAVKFGFEFNLLCYEFELKEFPIADFISSSDLIIAGQTVRFFYSGTEFDDNFLFQWDFGDEIGTANEINPNYSYKIPGFYTVILSICDVDGDKIIVKKINFIEVIEDKVPKANFTINTQFLIENEEIHFIFTGTSGNGLISFIWDFGDNFGISHESNPSYSYKTPGLFTIILIVIDLDGDNSTFIQYIRILENSDQNFLNITFNNKSLTYSFIFSFLIVSIIIVYSKTKRKNISKKIPLKSIKL
jgi:PKD repeat protein